MNKNNYLKGVPYVVLDDDGFMQLYTATGVKVELNIWLRVQDSYDNIATVIAKFPCNIVGTKQQMEAHINESEATKEILDSPAQQAGQDSTEIPY